MLSCLIQIEGKVQNVGFRYFTLSLANKLAIKGTVKNSQAGSVIIEAEGNKENMIEFLDQVKRGPSSARVIKCQITDLPFQHFSTFKIVS